MSSRLTAIIAGGGIGGLAAAAALARCGLAVTVVERAPRLIDIGAGMVLYPNGVAAADAISPRLGQRIRSSGYVPGPDEIRPVLGASGRILAEEPIGRMPRRYGVPQISILRSALQQALVDEATRAGAQLRLGLTVRDYVNDDRFVSVELSDGSTHRADLLVAADGIRSGIRQRMLGDGPPRYRGYTSVRGRTMVSLLRPQGFVANGRGIQVFAAPVAADCLYWTAKIAAPPEKWPELGPSGAMRTLVAELAGWHTPIVGLISGAKPADVAVSDVCDRDPAPCWVDGRVALLGDAAHPMTVALGQAVNMALEDAVVLADALRSHGAAAGRGDVRAALRDYQRQRTRRTAQVVRLSRRQDALDLGAGHIRSRVRDAVMRLRRRKDAVVPNIVRWTAPAPFLSPA
jgi:2-polyprenyl-6-methoxyphenol hydroxylase-like FAD-dependent oxidoreductase